MPETGAACYPASSLCYTMHGYRIDCAAIFRHDGMFIYIQTGGGIVADSVPENEWQETLNKGRAIFRAVSMAINDI